MYWKPQLSLASLLASGLGLALSLPVQAQDPEKTAADAAKGPLAELITNTSHENDFTGLRVARSRSQIVYILSAVESYANTRALDLSPPMIPGDDFTAPLAHRRWILHRPSWVSGPQEESVFMFKIPADSSTEARRPISARRSWPRKEADCLPARTLSTASAKAASGNPT